MENIVKYLLKEALTKAPLGIIQRRHGILGYKPEGLNAENIAQKLANKSYFEQFAIPFIQEINDIDLAKMLQLIKTDIDSIHDYPNKEHISKDGEKILIDYYMRIKDELAKRGPKRLNQEATVTEDNSFLADDNYTHFAIYKPSGKIAEAWNYSDVSPEDLKQDAKHYFTSDLKDRFPDKKPSEFTILSRKSLEKSGININDRNNWGN